MSKEAQPGLTSDAINHYSPEDMKAQGITRYNVYPDFGKSAFYPIEVLATFIVNPVRGCAFFFWQTPEGDIRIDRYNLDRVTIEAIRQPTYFGNMP